MAEKITRWLGGFLSSDTATGSPIQDLPIFTFTPNYSFFIHSVKGYAYTTNSGITVRTLIPFLVRFNFSASPLFNQVPPGQYSLNAPASLDNLVDDTPLGPEVGIVQFANPLEIAAGTQITCVTRLIGDFTAAGLGLTARVWVEYSFKS